MADDNWVKEMTDDFRGYFDDLLKHNPLMVQYETFCLRPAWTITRILNFLSVPVPSNLAEIVASRDVLKVDPRRPRWFVPIRFIRDEDRYSLHCLKWQRDPLMTEHVADMIWSELQDLMPCYGYTESGHDVSIFKSY